MKERTLSREIYIEHAKRIVSKEGFDKLTLRELAKNAKVSPMAVYRHFKNKDALLAALAAQVFENFNEKNKINPLAVMIWPTERCQEELIKLSKNYIRLAYEIPKDIRLMFEAIEDSFLLHPELHHAAEKFYEAPMLIMTRLFSHDGHDQETISMLARGYWSLIHGYAMLIVQKRIGLNNIEFSKLEKEIDTIASRYLKGI